MQIKPPFNSSAAIKLGVIGIILAIGAVAFLGFKTESNGSKLPEEIIRPVKAIYLSETNIAEKRSFPGLVQPSRDTKLAFRVGGPIVDLDVNVGRHVEKGTVIARIDPRDFELNVVRLEAILGQAHANLKALRQGARSEDIAGLKAQLAAAEVQFRTSENDFIRQKNLLADRAASKVNYDNAQKAYEMSKANLEAMTQELKKAQSGGRSEEIEAAEAGIKKLKADLTSARHALKDTELKAPYSGYVSRRFVENFENVMPMQPIVAFIDVSSVEVHAALPEDMIIRKSQITDIHCTLSAYPGQPVEAVIKEIGRKTDSANQSYPITVVLNVPKNLLVMPGMAATLNIALADAAGENTGFLLPAQAVYADSEGKTCVFRIDQKKMTVIKTPVNIESLGNNAVRILSGLTAGDRVVTAGAKFLRENQKVRILNDEKERSFMKLTEYAISKKTLSYFTVLLLVAGGVYSFQKLGKLEFPSFTIKTAVVATPYPGASALEVEQEVTDLLEKAIQQMSQVKEVRSISQTGLSIIYIDIKETYFSEAMPQIWDELRRKVFDAVKYLPQGAGPATVNDDFGDVYGVFFAITGDGYSDKELKDYADFLKRELLLVKNVAGVETWGEQQEVIYLEMEKSRMAKLGISMESIFGTLNRQNQVVDAGRLKLDNDYIRVTPTGEFTQVEELGNLLISSDTQGNLIYLKDVVTIRRGYQDPPRWIMRYNGWPAIGLGIATVDGGNVVEMGKAVRTRIKQLQSETPVGIKLETIAFQSDLVSKAVNNFMVNLVEAVVIVIAVLCVTMGLSSGILMGVILLLTILGTFIIMRLMAIDLHIISLGALILALGMLVDNAIVVTEGVLVRVQQNTPRFQAAISTVNQNAWPLLGATFVAILAFAGIGTSKDVTGEFLNSLFLVMAISLGLSWLLAVTLTPLFCVLFMRRPKMEKDSSPYDGKFFQRYRGFLDLCLHHRILTIGTLTGLMLTALLGFSFVQQNFFPNDSRNQFIINVWRPEGAHITQTAAGLEKVENYLTKVEQVSAVTTFVGQGSLRFLLSYEPQMPNTAYGQALVTVKDFRSIDTLISRLRTDLAELLPDAMVEFKKIALGPDPAGKIEARFQGPDIAVLRQLSQEAQKVMAADPLSIDVGDDWRQQTLVVRPKVDEAAARRLGITRPQIADMLAMNFSGRTVGVYREENRLIPMVLRTPLNERGSVEQIDDMTIMSPATGQALPLRQIVSGVTTQWEDPIIRRRDRMRTVSALANQLHGNASVLFNRLRPQIEAMKLPPGYTFKWGGEYEKSSEAQAGLFQMIPIFFLAMVFTVMALFNAVRQTVIIFICLPLATIGVTAGLLLFNEPFGFMCLLGFIGLSGMLIKNAVVLIDQIDLEIRAGKDPYIAILDSSVSRIRPVTMAALTTVLGMLPLVTDSFFAGMSVTIMGGLTFGTVLTLLIVPVLYASFYGIRPRTTSTGNIEKEPALIHLQERLTQE